jgi:hypothetical protein
MVFNHRIDGKGKRSESFMNAWRVPVPLSSQSSREGKHERSGPWRRFQKGPSRGWYFQIGVKE